MTHNEIYKKVVIGLKYNIPIIKTLNKYNYSSPIFYSNLTLEERSNLSIYKSLTIKTTPSRYKIPLIEGYSLNIVEEYLREFSS